MKRKSLARSTDKRNGQFLLCLSSFSWEDCNWNLSSCLLSLWVTIVVRSVAIVRLLIVAWVWMVHYRGGFQEVGNLLKGTNRKNCCSRDKTWWFHWWIDVPFVLAGYNPSLYIHNPVIMLLSFPWGFVCQSVCIITTIITITIHKIRTWWNDIVFLAELYSEIEFLVEALHFYTTDEILWNHYYFSWHLSGSDYDNLHLTTSCQNGIG